MLTSRAYALARRRRAEAHPIAARPRAMERNGTRMDGSRAAGVIAVILKGYPRLSETFIAQELRALERARARASRSFRCAIRPTARRIRSTPKSAAPVAYLPEYLHDEPVRVWRAWRRARRLPGYRAARAAWWRDFAARSHAQTHPPLRPGAGARRGAAARRRPSARAFPAHAGVRHALRSARSAGSRGAARPTPRTSGRRPIGRSGKSSMRARGSRRAPMSMPGTSASSRGPAQRVDLNYHGIDTARFPAPTQAPSRHATAETPRSPVDDPRRRTSRRQEGIRRPPRRARPASAGLALAASSISAADRCCRSCRRWRATLGLAERIQWRGPQSQAAVLDAYRSADIFVLPCRVSADGDRDGLPNVLLEAQSQKLACVSTRVSGIPELIDDGVTRAPRRAPRALRRWPARWRALIADPALRQRLGDAGFARTTRRILDGRRRRPARRAVRGHRSRRRAASPPTR